MNRSGVLLAGLLGAVIALPAGAFDLTDTSSTESKLYLNLNFGGSAQGISALHYGVRVDRATQKTVRQNQPMTGASQRLRSTSNPKQRTGSSSRPCTKTRRRSVVQ